jgi:acyl transferase domain-containing protein/NAD(P)H-dependent flavin oxidoreductase YrpB (nitropropane dioxygenase family)/NADP-dependent 3-hydroxy acid dehydrogenase YdfG
MAFIIGISPFEHPDPALIAAICRAGALGILDLGRDPARARAALAELARRAPRFGVRIPDGSAIDLPSGVTTVVVPAGAPILPGRTWRVLVQVTSIDEARAAMAAGADGLIARGSESALVEGETAFVLLQRLRAELPEAPIWVQGGVGLHTAAACVAGGAHGVVLDAQLALLEESSFAHKDALAALDGSVDDARKCAARLGLPIGPDAAFARPLAARFGSAGRLVRGLEQAAGGHLRQARLLDPVGPDAPLARAHGLRYPIAQGPMTRVSDRAPFAAAVADAGGLPFLALSLMRAAEARPLLEETRARLAGRPWGVGILGFVPPELRDEQLALVRELRPPVALIAGGRPAQAAPLEEAGIVTYLHVPSPGLLDLFLKDGARRFVLEGRECGGHVGPRSSFVLWDSAVERLLAEPDLREVSVLFAGGVHDGRSAAMVAALAAPLAARGARVGVLAGTAYLFTDEAVAAGAIQPAFQAEALRCQRTALLDTAPGHSTRCVDTDYIRAFNLERARLEAEGVPAREMWEALEQLNLGRLRIAAKGLVRDGADLVPVDEATQRRQGMYMIGQVAALRRATCTVAELHADISAGARAHLDAARLEPAPAQPLDVAIVGMAAIFPGAPDLASYWANIVQGRNSITEVPPERWSASIYYDPAGTGDKTPSKWGGFVPEIAFDPAAFGIPPRSLAAIEPVQLLALEVARRALDDAGYADRPFDRERASVVFGAEGGTDLSGAYGFRAVHPQFLGPIPKALDDKLPRLTEDSFPGVLANVIAGRIANRLDLGGTNYTVDAACASSLAAVDVACKELAGGTSDLVLAGGADLHNSINDFLMFASVHALSPTGQCKPFDASADGIALGEGVAALVLKRRADAERDGDRIYAVIKGVGGSSDGRSLGLTAPRKEGQVRALERAYERAGVSPAEVELVEAHGTGTVVGDRTELATLNEIWGAAGALPATVTLGSVKSQIGHTKCAAGMAGVIKAALAIHSRVLPPTRNLKQTNPAYEPSSSPFLFRDAAQPWASGVRRAGVSAFGFGGTNFHVVLEGQGEAAAGLDAWPCELVVVRARSRAEAEARRARLCAAAESGVRLRDVARTAARLDGAVWLAVVARGAADLAAAPLVEPATAGPVALLFPGQGSQRPGMCAELFVTFPELAPILARGARWLGRLFPGVGLSPDQRAAQLAALTDTRVAQPALGMCDLAVARLLDKVGVHGTMLAGHSYGELAALAVAGALDEAELLELSEARALAILEAAAGAPGTMAAVAASAERVAGLVDGVALANRNAPDQTVIAGSDEAVERALARLATAGVTAKKIPVACAFHSPIVARAAETFARRLADASVAAPRLPVYANTTAAPYPADPAAVRALLARQIAEPVRFADEIEAMYAAGARVFVEAGPGAVLTDLVGRVLGDRPHLAVACQGGLESFLGALARLAQAGVPVDVGALFAGRDARAFDLDAPPRVAPAPTSWLVNGQLARPMSGPAPEFAMTPVLEPVAAAAAPVPQREATVLEYLKGMRELVESQKQVMLRFLGTEPASVSEAAAESVSASASVTVTESVTESVSVPVSDPLTLLVAIVSERTGYPPEMLNPDLDLEADLGIDSIKRIEILGTLGERLGMQAQNGKRSELVEKLATVKTLRGIATSVTAAEPATATATEPESSVARFILAPTPLPPPTGDHGVIFNRSFALTRDDGGVADELAALLAARGAHVRVLAHGEPLGRADGLIHLEALAAVPPDDPRKTLFARAKEAVDGGATWLLAATGHGGAFGRSPATRLPQGGMAGFLKSVAQELPTLRARSVDLDPEQPPSVLAATIFAELIADDPHIEVGYDGEQRQTLTLLRAEPGVEPSPELVVGPESVVLVTGGARGITARVAVALAERSRCRLELVGRSPLPTDELADCPDAPALRRALLRTESSPAAIEARVARILAGREARATLAAIERAGGRASYHACDVRDDAAFGALIDRIYEQHGRIDGAIHGAGIIEDKLLAQKTPDSFDRVFDTKVRSALTLAEKLRPDVRFIVFFSSISGAFGNRGQADYAAANDALDKLAHHLSSCMLGRIVSINWGPWGGAGMITPELEREYGRRGIGLIPLEEGVNRLFDELGRGDAAQVLLMHESAAEKFRA